jgi:hypothetical protein
VKLVNGRKARVVLVASEEKAGAGRSMRTLRNFYDIQ